MSTFDVCLSDYHPIKNVVLAVQNMEASGKVEQVEFNALGGSLSMMSKVLNDVLDLYVVLCILFVPRPYSFL